jgi:hypothetical protein
MLASETNLALTRWSSRCIRDDRDFRSVLGRILGDDELSSLDANGLPFGDGPEYDGV